MMIGIIILVLIGALGVSPSIDHFTVTSPEQLENRNLKLYDTLSVDMMRCEEKLSICEKNEADWRILNDNLQKKIDYLNELLASQRDANKQLRSQLKETLVEKSKLQEDNHLWFVRTVAMVAILSLIILWLLLPGIIMALRICAWALQGVAAWVAAIPSRLVSNVLARAEVREESIPLVQVTREAVLPSSPLKSGCEADKSVFKIFIVDQAFPDQIHFNGLGFWSAVGDSSKRSQGLFMTAQHCLPYQGDVLLQNANDPAKKVLVPANAWVRMEEYDVAYLTPEQRITTKLGIRKAKVPNGRLKESVVVTVTGRDKQSMGPLKAYPDSVNLKYTGSTLPGFSGSPYVAGRTAYGMHLGSTTEQGMGIDLGFLNLKLTRTLNVRPESTEDWIIEQIQSAARTGKKIKWQRYGMEDVIVEIRGKDFFLGRDEFDEIYDDCAEALEEYEFFDKDEYGHRQKTKKNKKKWQDSDDEDFDLENYVDIESLPKNVMTPTPALVVGEKPVLNARKLNNVKLSKLKTSPLEVKAMDGQPSTAAASKEALPVTLESLRSLLEDQQRRFMKTERKLDTLYAKIYAKDVKSKPKPKA